MAAVRHGKDISIRFGQGVFKLVLGGFYGFGDTRSRPFDDKLAGVLVGGSAADRVDSAVEHILYEALREVKPLKLLSEHLFGSRFILLRGCRLSRGAFGALCGFFPFLCDVLGDIRGFKVFPREPLHHNRKAVFTWKLAARAGASEYLSFSRKIRRCVVWIFPAAAAFPENQRFVRCFAQVGEFALGAYFFRIRYRRRIFGAAERISSSVTICAVGIASLKKDNMIMMENNGKCNALFSQIDYEAQKPGVTEGNL